jgi:biopolymer transport protein ExbD
MRETSVPGPARSSRRRAVLVCLYLAFYAIEPSAFGDDFGRITGPAFFEMPERSKQQRTAHLSLRTIESLPEVVRGERAALVIATTDQGNLAKLLVSPGLRRQAGGGNKPAMVAVINLERFETVDAGDRVSWKARGRDVLLFDGFEFDLDTGQVVPPGFGGDIRYSPRGESGPELTALGQNALYAIDKPLPVPPAQPGRPSPGPAVVPGDFQGRYTLISNGQTSGTLEIAVDAAGAVTGRFRSDRNGAVYPVSGTVAADLPRRIEFEIKFPRTRQVFDGLLWTEEKNVFAGTVQILEHPYSFVAVREGAALLPESIDATSSPRAPSALKASTRVVTLDATTNRYVLDGASKSAEELTAALSAAVKSDPSAAVLLRAAPATTYERVQQSTRLVRDAGITTIRLAPATPD